MASNLQFQSDTMAKCPNCGRETERTKNLACPWCGYPLITRDYHWGAIIYLLAITIAETVTVFFAPLWGIISHIVILVVLILHSALASEHRYRQLVLSLSLVPLVRIMSLSMPLSDIPQIWWYPIIYAPLLAATIAVIRLTGYRAKDVGLTVRLLPVQLAVGLTGVLFGVAEYFILTPEAIAAAFTWQEIWLPALFLLMCTGFVEEFIFRGVLQRTAVGAFGGWGIVYVSLLFAILHMGFLSWIDVVFVFVVALFFGWVVKKTGSLFGVTLAHGITNIVLYLIIPFFV
jgi:membrane protease YdiL (CAAX protease family)